MVSSPGCLLAALRLFVLRAYVVKFGKGVLHITSGGCDTTQYTHPRIQRHLYKPCPE